MDNKEKNAILESLKNIVEEMMLTSDALHGIVEEMVSMNETIDDIVDLLTIEEEGLYLGGGQDYTSADEDLPRDIVLNKKESKQLSEFACGKGKNVITNKSLRIKSDSTKLQSVKDGVLNDLRAKMFKVFGRDEIFSSWRVYNILKSMDEPRSMSVVRRYLKELENDGYIVNIGKDELGYQYHMI